jgi:hypothetical protein
MMNHHMEIELHITHWQRDLLKALIYWKEYGVA